MPASFDLRSEYRNPVPISIPIPCPYPMTVAEDRGGVRVSQPALPDPEPRL